MTAVIDGVNWVSSAFAQKAQVGNFGLIQIQGSQNSTTMIISLFNIDSVGTYDLGMGGTNVGGSAQITDILSRGWNTPLSGAAGTITITTLTASRIVGSFVYDADAFFGTATGTKVVTQGSFDLLLGFSGSTTWPLPDQYGSRMAGTVAGALWKPATVVIALQSGAIVIGANNTSYSISIGKTSFAGVGSYNLGSQATDPVVVMSGPWTNPNGPVNCCWGGGVGNTGTLNITSQTATRIQGFLDATLVPSAGTAASGPLTIDSLAFDIGLP